MTKKKKTSYLLIALTLFISIFAISIARPGRTDSNGGNDGNGSNGGNWDGKTDTYHYHNNDSDSGTNSGNSGRSCGDSSKFEITSSSSNSSNISGEKKEEPTAGELELAPINYQELKVHIIDVGQADCIFIQAPKKNMLIDAGNDADSNLIISYLKNLGISKIDIVVGTHPHEDHIGSLDSVINTFDIGKIYMPKVSHNTKTFEDVLTAIKNKGLKVTTAIAGVSLDLGKGLTAKMLAPNSSKYNDLNDYSAVIKLTFGNTSFLFTGDAETVSEQKCLQRSMTLKLMCLK